MRIIFLIMSYIQLKLYHIFIWILDFKKGMFIISLLKSLLINLWINTLKKEKIYKLYRLNTYNKYRLLY